MNEPQPPALPDRARSSVRAARVIAVVSDALQIFLFPLFGEGFASPVNDALDVVVSAAMLKLLGFHWALLPTLATELVPGADLVPTWTAAVFLITGSEGVKHRVLWGAATVIGLLAVAVGTLVWWWRR